MVKVQSLSAGLNYAKNTSFVPHVLCEVLNCKGWPCSSCPAFTKNGGTESPGGGAGQRRAAFGAALLLCLGSKEGAQEKCGVELSLWSFFLQQPALESELWTEVVRSAQGLSSSWELVKGPFPPWSGVSALASPVGSEGTAELGPLPGTRSIPSPTTGKCSCQPHQAWRNFSWVWITDWCRAEVSFLTSRLNLRCNLYFCSDLVFPVLLAKWPALKLVLARCSHDMKCCPSQTSPTVSFSKGIFEKGLWVGTFKCWVQPWIYNAFKSPPVTNSFSVWPPVPSLEKQNRAGWSQNLKSL